VLQHLGQADPRAIAFLPLATPLGSARGKAGRAMALEQIDREAVYYELCDLESVLLDSAHCLPSYQSYAWRDIRRCVKRLFALLPSDADLAANIEPSTVRELQDFLHAIEDSCSLGGAVGKGNFPWQGHDLDQLRRLRLPFTPATFSRAPSCPSEFARYARTFIRRDEQNGNKPDGKRKGSKPGVNARMLETIQKDTDAMGWSSAQWAKHLKCVKSTVVDTQAWKDLKMGRERVKAQRALDRRRRSRGSDGKRD
jgi:hypothetical protein